MKYEILDLSKSLYQDTVVIEAPSPKKAAENHFGFRVERCVGGMGNIVVYSKSYPRRGYVYKRLLTQHAPDAGAVCGK